MRPPRTPAGALIRPPRTPAGALVRLAAAVLALAGCASGGATVAKGPPVTVAAPAQTYVAVGASETVGIGADDPLSQSWPQVLFHTAFPASTIYTNVGIPGETVAEALRDELPLALSLKPRVVTVWLNVNDALARVGASAYQAQLDQLVHALRDAAGPKRTTVLVANTPPVEELPAYLACIPGGSSYPGFRPGQRCLVGDRSELPDVAGVQRIVTSYNAATAAVVTREGAALVDLHALGAAAGAPAGGSAGGFAGLTGRDGFHPSTAGHAAVAAAFAAVLAKLGVEPAVRPSASKTSPSATSPSATSPSGPGG